MTTTATSVKATTMKATTVNTTTEVPAATECASSEAAAPIKRAIIHIWPGVKAPAGVSAKTSKLV